jgi:hypothetical protein
MKKTFDQIIRLGRGWLGLVALTGLVSHGQEAGSLVIQVAGKQVQVDYQLPAPPAPADTDGNGLPDAWELQLFGYTGVDPKADPDGDGLTNLQEYQQGTNPNDYYNGITPIMTSLADFSAQLGRDGMIAVRVTDPQNNLLINAPVEFTTSAENLLTANPYGRGKSTVVTIRTDDTGVARVYVRPAGQ